MQQQPQHKQPPAQGGQTPISPGASGHSAAKTGSDPLTLPHPAPQYAMPPLNAKPTAADVAKAELILGPPERGSDRYALEMLVRLGEFLDEFVTNARERLKKIEPARLDAIINQVEPEPVEQAPQKRPRGSKHPILLLHQWALAAARLLKQVIKATNPSLFVSNPDKAEALAVARQSHDFYMAMTKNKAIQIIAAGVQA